jgi:GMP synthase PP-ATPase subunit
VAKLKAENKRLRSKLAQAEVIIGVQGKVHAEAIAVMSNEGLAVKTACWVLEVTTAGFYEWRTRRRRLDPSGESGSPM